MPVVERAVEFFLLAWFQSDLAEVAEDGAVYSNDYRSAVVAALTARNR